jgi:hypothetical protein
MTLASETRASVRILAEAFGRAEGWRPTGLLVDALIEPRYGNVPPEAFPFLDAGVDGCHYALWIDDATSTREPPIVWVCPMDGTPDTVHLVARDARAFVDLVEVAGLWRDGDEAIVSAARELAWTARREHVRHETADGMGVVAAVERVAARPDASTLRTWREAPPLFSSAVDGWLAAGTPALALAVARDLVADHDASGLDGFGAILQRIYVALGRNLHAEIARASYARDPAVSAALAEFFKST